MTDTERAERRPPCIPAGRSVLDAKTPNLTAEEFRDRYYPARMRPLSHSGGKFTAAGVRVAREDLAAQIYEFMSDACDAKGDSFNPTPGRVNAVLRCLAMAAQYVNVPRRAGS